MMVVYNTLAASTLTTAELKQCGNELVQYPIHSPQRHHTHTHKHTHTHTHKKHICTAHFTQSP